MWAMRRMTSRGVKWSPASSFACSLNFRIRYSNKYPISRFGTVFGCKSTVENSLIISNNMLFEIIKEFSTVDLHPNTVPNLEMGYLFEYLIRKFNEQANEEAGDHFTPREVIRLMAHILYTGDEDIHIPGISRTIYDPTCGT